MSSLSTDLKAASTLPGDLPWYVYIIIAFFSALTTIVGLSLRFILKRHDQKILENENIRKHDLKMRQLAINSGKRVQQRRKPVEQNVLQPQANKE